MGDSLKFDIDAVELQTIQNPEVVNGWKPAENRIIFSTTGYRSDSENSVIVRVNNHSEKFRIVDYTTYSHPGQRSKGEALYARTA